MAVNILKISIINKTTVSKGSVAGTLGDQFRLGLGCGYLHCCSLIISFHITSEVK
jgi:hypothetical protein